AAWARVQGTGGAESAFAGMVSARAQAVIVQGIFFSKAIADLAIKYRLPSASVLRSYPHVGGLMSYGADIPHIFRRSAVLVHKILQGTKPADLPVEQPTKFDLAINLKTAKAIGLAIQESFLLRADELIECNAANLSWLSAARRPHLRFFGRSRRARSNPRCR